MHQTFSTTPKEWARAKRPNYWTNEDLRYPYSECPYLGQYHLIKIPKTGLVDLVDYWGEGRIHTSQVVSGFRDCYNVNHTYQLVSNGKDTNCKIPNRIPVQDYNNCNTDKYIKDDSVRIVTVMSAPINPSCADDITRMINPEEGLIVLFGYDRYSQDIKDLEQKLNIEKLVYCPRYNLPRKLHGTSMDDYFLAFVNLIEYTQLLYDTTKRADFDYAVELCLELKQGRHDFVVETVVEKLLHEVDPEVTTLAYKLWISGGQELVVDHFPSIYQNILDSDIVKLVSHKYYYSLRLDSNTDQYGDRMALGVFRDNAATHFKWKFIPKIENNQAVFKIENDDYTMFLKLDVNSENYGDRHCWGSKSYNEKRHKWLLEPTRLGDGSLVFFIVNFEYNQALKLGEYHDVNGIRQAWGHSGKYADDPEGLGWKINS